MLGKRSYPKLPSKYVYSLPHPEVMKKIYQLRRKPVDYFYLNESFQEKALKRFSPPEICISFDMSSNVLFRNWKGKSKLVLDLTIGVPQYRLKIQHGDQFNWKMLNDVDPVSKRMFAQYVEEVNLADIILCGSEFVKNTVSWLNPDNESKCRVLPYGVDLEDFGNPNKEFVEKKDLQFVFVGTVGWRKGADVLLKAWKNFVALHPECELHFFGAVDNHIDLSDMPANVHMHGMVNRAILVEQLKKMDVFVFPTTFEGSSIAVFQAMAMQLPVITTANSGTVLKHGISCEMIEVGNVYAVTNAMEKLYADLAYRKAIAQQAYRLSNDYTWQHYKDRLSQILNEDELIAPRKMSEELQVSVDL
ncbi:glycosyltransferase family 4 protein [Niastella koreensis]|nr:glycosyltransferase family 4 protein [Niastella koreensis]